MSDTSQEGAMDPMQQSRRRFIQSSMALALAVSLTSPAIGKPMNTLVAYFSRSGNTRVIAGTIHRGLPSDIFEIKALKAYPDDYEQTVERARVERDRGIEPELEERVPDIRSYDTIYLGFPIWGETAPPIIRSFLKVHDVRDKTIRPFITHGGYGLGNSLAVLATHVPASKLEPAFSMEADQERRTINEVSRWLKANDQQSATR
jgi:flavodoxin